MARAANVAPDSLSGPVILFISYAGVYGGAERLLVDWAGGLQREVAVACPPGPLADACARVGLRVLPLRGRDLRLRGRRGGALAQLAAHAREVRGLTRGLAPELVIAWGMRSLLAAVTLRGAAGCPVAFQHNDFVPAGLVGGAVRRAARQADLTLALSGAVLSDLRLSARSRRRACVVMPGIDLERFGAAAASSPAQPPEIIVLGAIVPWKRPDLALEVFARVRERLPGATLRIAGAPLPGDDSGEALLAALHRRAEQADVAGAVHFAGAVDDVPSSLGRASLLLHCADHEPFGIVVAEALAAGRPAVVPDSSGPAEIVDASCGRRYRIGDAAAAAEAVAEILQDDELARDMGVAGRRRVAEHFERTKQQAAYETALAPLLSRRAQRASLSRELAVVTVTHNSAGHLRRLLASLDRHLPGARVVVVDCASSDDTLAIARARPATDVRALPNVGFGTASNRGVARVREPFTALVNPDVELIDDSLLELVVEARRSSSPPRILAPRVLNPDGSLQDTVHPAPLSAADLARAVIPPALLRGPAGTWLAPQRSSRPRTVGWAVGCALLARTDVLRSLGPFNERIFLYGEDMELGLRAAGAGIETWLWPAARVIHHGGHSIEVAYGGEAFELRAQARHDAVALARGRGRARLDDAAQALTFANRLVLKRALGRPAQRERRQLTAVLRVARSR
jgi:GT2 family glycosyltransferase/glycosyltransferase involved in cell wall biosynthesis